MEVVTEFTSLPYCDISPCEMAIEQEKIGLDLILFIGS